MYSFQLISFQHLLIWQGQVSLSCGLRTLRCGIRDLLPDPGSNPGSSTLGVWSLNHRPPGKSLSWFLNYQRHWKVVIFLRFVVVQLLSHVRLCSSMDYSMPAEKAMATHSSVPAWRISGMGKPGGLPSMGSHRVRHNWSDLAAAAASFIC